MLVFNDPVGQFVRTSLNFICNCVGRSLLILWCCWPVSHQGNLQRRKNKSKVTGSWNAEDMISAKMLCPGVACTLCSCSLVVSSPLPFRSTLKGVQGDLEMRTWCNIWSEHLDYREHIELDWVQSFLNMESNAIWDAVSHLTPRVQICRCNTV